MFNLLITSPEPQGQKWLVAFVVEG